MAWVQSETFADCLRKAKKYKVIIERTTQEDKQETVRGEKFKYKIYKPKSNIVRYAHDIDDALGAIESAFKDK